MTPDRIAAYLDDISILEREAPDVLRHFLGGIKAVADKYRKRVEIRGVGVYVHAVTPQDALK